jgi:hypothetical protein
MGRTHLTFRLRDEAIAIIVARQNDLSAVQHREVDRTEALEDLILNPPQKLRVSNFFRRKKLAPDPQTRSLEVFTSA